MAKNVYKNLVYTVILLFIDFFLLKLSFKYTISVFTKQNVLLNIYIPNFRTFRHFIKKLCSFLFLLKSYCFLYTGLSYYSDDILYTLVLQYITKHVCVCYPGSCVGWGGVGVADGDAFQSGPDPCVSCICENGHASR